MRLELETNRFYLARYYSEAVEAAGGLPVHVALIPNPEYIAGVMAGIDGLLLPGSDPSLPGREKFCGTAQELPLHPTRHIP